MGIFWESKKEKLQRERDIQASKQRLKQKLGELAESWDKTKPEEKEEFKKHAKTLINHAANSTSIRQFFQKISAEDPARPKLPAEPPEL